MPKDKYFNFPIALLQNLVTNKMECLNNIFDLGIYKFAQKSTSKVSFELYQNAASYYGITFKKLGNDKKSYSNAIALSNSIEPGFASVGISLTMLFDFYKNDKTEIQLLQLACFLAIKSILGKKAYCKTNKALIHARMFGYNSTTDFNIETMQELQLKYCPIQSKYHIDKLLYLLQTDWHLKLFSSHSRGFYLSFKCSVTDLAIISEQQKNLPKQNNFCKPKKMH